MALELDFAYQHGATTYCIVYDRTSRPWNGAAFEAYTTLNYATYVNAATELGTASQHYAATMPAAIPAGVYGVEARQQKGGSPAETDPVIAAGDFQWNGAAEFALSDVPVSGNVSAGGGPVKIYRGQMVANFPFYMVGSADHVQPLTSGVISGMISRDGSAAWAVLQSGLCTELGFGGYAVTLTSGDLLCNTALLRFYGVGVSGGSSDPRVFSLVLQRSSGTF